MSTLSEDGQLRPIISDLPGLGDHQANQLAFGDGSLYLIVPGAGDAALPVATGTLFSLLIVVLLLVLLVALAAGPARVMGVVAGAAIGAMAGLVMGAFMMFVVSPILPLVSDKGFPPLWYAISFGVFGTVLGAGAYLVARRRRGLRPGLQPDGMDRRLAGVE